MNALPLPLLLALNGIIMVMVAAMISSAAIYLHGKLREYGRAREVFVECKATLALITLLIGLEIRTAAIWYVQLQQHRGLHPSQALLDAVTALLIFGSFPLAWGCICWMRVVQPYRCRPWIWVAIAGGAGAFGIGVALWW